MNSTPPPSKLEQQLRDMNEALLVSSMHQHELTEQAQLAEAANAKLAAIVESSGDAIISKDLDGVITSWNKGAQRLFGYTADEAIGKPVTLLIPEDHLDEEPMILDRIRRGESVDHYETVRRRKNGTLLDISLTVSPIRNAAGRVIGASKVARDITGQKQAEAALRDSEERYRNLFNSMDEGYCIIEMIFDEHEKPVDYRFLEVNPAFEKQSGMHDVIGKRMLEFVSDIEETWLANYGNAALTGTPTRFANEYKTLDRWFDVYAFKVGGRDSRRVAVLFTNITERKQAEKQMREQAEALADLHRRKDEFLAMLSHELRNPLAPISNAVQLLRLQKNENALQQQARTIIERQVGQMTRLIDDLLEVSRITTGRIHLHRERVTLGGIVENAVETVRTLIGQRGHVLKVSLPPEPIWLDADAARLEQVMVNLLNNAAKYTDEGGHIWLGVTQEGDEAVLRVRDTGVGIAPELLPHIFDLFTQSERSLDRSQGGLGIGLALVQRLVEMHRGTVEAHSSLGRGSEFVVRLPVVLTVAPQTLPAATEARPTGTSCRVLVVDDNMDATQSLEMLLITTGHQVRTAYDGPTGLKVALDFRPDVVLLDIGLPELSGHEVARRIRQQPTLKDTVLVAMTGYGQETDRQRSLEAGFDHHLVKPADFGKVQQVLATVSEKKAT
ncbi:MAG TPA: PAS domain S-box protein [Fimbriiglobus sp.]|nr:PAS domain S-box protein [Fimbriiglobus sp.]